MQFIEEAVPIRFIRHERSGMAFLNITPFTLGHTYFACREGVGQWIDLDPGLTAHLVCISQATIGKAVQESFEPEKVGL
jgi:diadenosine tetraphosphate (Ap4A) HIT family hydrolase